MLKKIISSSLAVLLLLGNAITAWAGERPEEEAAKRIAKAKAEVAKLGTGAKAGVKVKLLNGVELKGLVVENKDDEFIVDDPKTGQATTIRYQDVSKVKKWNRDSGNSKKVAIGLVAGALVGLGIYAAVGLRELGKIKIGEIKLPSCLPNCPPTP
jgi:hypothetical protein